MNDNYFRTLFLCILSSFSLLIASHVLLHNPWMSLVAGCGPLVYYHLLYLTPRAHKGLTQTAIDSVYYFGFLVTVAALGISAVTIASSGGMTDINTVVFQFGVGLFATGYAVIARMHLSSVSTMVNAASPEAILDRYIKRSMEMVDNVEAAVNHTSEFSKTVISRTTEISDNAKATVEKAMLDMARIFENEMRSTLALTRDGITEIRGLVADTSFVTEREELARSIKATIEASTKVNLALEDYALKSRLGAQATEQNTIVAGHLEKALAALRADINILTGNDGSLQKAASSIADAGQLIAIGTSKVGEAVQELASISGAVADTGPTFQKMKTNAKKAQEQLDTLTNVTERLDASLSGISTTAQATGTLAAELERTAKALPELTLKSEQLGACLGGAIEASQRITRHLAAMPEQVETIKTFSTDITQVLKIIGNSVEGAAIGSRELKSNFADATSVINGVTQLLASANGLQATVGALQQVLDTLTNTALATQTALSDSTLSIKRSVSTSADLLEADVKRSSAAASLLTDRLIRVAQSIIDQTRQRQGQSS